MDLVQSQKLWVLTHLLFPNSAQARDVYLFFINDFNKNSKVDLFKKILQIYLKTEIIQSNLFFAEFENPTVKLWPVFYKKLNKEERLFLIAKLIYEFNIKDLSRVFKGTENQVTNKFLATVYKIIPKPEFKTKAAYKFELTL